MCINGRFLRVLLVLAIGIFLTNSLLTSCGHAQLLYTGTNLSGAEFGEGNIPGTYGTEYIYPTNEEIDYFVGKGMNTFRIPFRWERLQLSQNTVFDPAELSRLTSLVDYATGQGAHVILDPHNYARYHGGVIGDAAVPNASFNDFWTRLANEFKSNDQVILGLMNEPNDMPTEQWFSAAQESINAIRATGASNLLLVPGNGYTGAHAWSDDYYGTPNADVMIDITDPGNNFAFELHQYLDSDSSGRTTEIVSETIGQERLVDVTNWLRTNNKKAFLGEFAVGNSTIGAGIGDEATANMLTYMAANDDVWIGWTWWGGGPWWGEYIFAIDPTDLGEPNEADRPVLGVLEPFFVQTASADFDGSGIVDGSDFLIWQRGFGLNDQQNNLQGDANGDGMVNAADLLVFHEQFGQTATSTIASTQVPEPASSVSVFVFVVAYFAGRW